MTRRIPGLFGLVLAGGEARRMGGGDKPLLEVGGRTMLERVIAVLQAEAEAVAISANGDPQRFAGFELLVLGDGAFAGRGPLAGLLAGLDWAAQNGASTLLTVPGDTPFVPPDLAAALHPAPSCAESAGRPHYLVALWPVFTRDALRQRLEAGGIRAVQAFAASIGMRQVPFASEYGDPFLNVNTNEDLTRARALVHHLSTRESGK